MHGLAVPCLPNTTMPTICKYPAKKLYVNKKHFYGACFSTRKIRKMRCGVLDAPGPETGETHGRKSRDTGPRLHAHLLQQGQEQHDRIKNLHKQM
jgi:hypothetical protein